MPEPTAVRRWRDFTAPAFVFAAKGSRFLTHMKRLTDHGRDLERFYTRASILGEKLAVVLWQLPPQMARPDIGLLDAFLDAQPAGPRQVFEFRSEAWYTREVCAVLDRHGAAFCEHDLIDIKPPRLTGGFRYLRFHGVIKKYQGRYGPRRLQAVSRDLDRYRRCSEEAFVFFNNDRGGAALYDAREKSVASAAELRAKPPKGQRSQ